ncbi:MAG: GNAT family N-acetyltransferase [Flavobacteriales bacterium]|nr:GNAT family N-acetyltransferase [Flavobacteriales bacterium]
MTISGFGIELVRLKAEHIEMVRGWRNDDSISRFMDFRKHITSEAQQEWFAALDPDCDFYFLISNEGDFHGLIHFSNIDWTLKVGQSGLFIRTKEYQGTPLPVCASALMLEYFFTSTPLLAIEAKVMNDNPVALAYNLGLGFTETVSEHPERFKRLRLEREGYHHTFAKKLALLKRVHGGHVMVGE